MNQTETAASRASDHAIVRRRILRPKPSRWDIMFCCNDHRNGMATGKVDTIKFGIGRGNFEFGTDWCDDQELTIQGPEITFRWIDANHFKLSRWKHRCLGSRQWVGNWCWDACFVATHTVREVATMLRNRRWSPEEGSEILWNWWDKLPSA